MTTVMVVEDDPAFLTRFCRIVGADAELALFAAVGDLKVVQVIGAGGLLINPTEQDIESEIGPDIAANYRGAGVDAKSRIHLAKLAWDATGTQFGQRMLQYEPLLCRRPGADRCDALHASRGRRAHEAGRAGAQR